MILIVYRWRLKPDHEASFHEGWRLATERGLADFGSGGSALCKLDDGTWMGVARWPDRASLERFRAGPADPKAFSLMADAVAESFPPLESEVVDDLWAPISPPA